MKPADLALATPAVAVRFPPVWTHIQPLSVYVGAMLEAKGKAEGAERVAIVVNELLENAVKYGDPASEVKFELFADAGQALVVRVTNKAHPARVAILERELKRNTTTSPHEAFARAIDRLQHLPEGSTMLGLARVSLEADLNVDTTGNIVVATAKVDISAGRTGAQAGSGASQTRRAVNPTSGTGQSSSALKAVGNAEVGQKRR